MRKITADYIYPGNTTPIKGGTITLNEEGEVLNISLKTDADAEYFQGIICPGFVNVHCHTELSYAKNQLPEKSGIDQFIHDLEGLKRRISEEEKADSVISAFKEMQENGIVAVGDIMNTTLSIDAKKSSPIACYNFIEVYGSQAKDTERNWNHALGLAAATEGTKNIVPHAPYSLSRTLFQKIRDYQKPKSTLSIHHMESEGEGEYFLKGTGPLAERFKSWGLEQPPHIPTHKRPLESLGEFFHTAERLLLIHNTFINQADIDFAKKHFQNSFYGLCPNANLYIEGDLPPLNLLKNQDLKICLGTDSLASNHQLSILEEMKILNKNFDVSLEELIRWATYNGACALGMNSKLGSIEKGKSPGILLLQNKSTAKSFDLTNASVQVIEPSV
ncbi:MAG: amidohydrolase family protein [Bacteroidales bacterium]|nr:amidohydrolase family protein [Bacteroidales bacterium]